MLNIALFGPPGAGKGTQARLLAEKYNLTYISTGDILRKEIADGTALGLLAKSVIERGGLVDDEIIVQIIEEHIEMNPNSNGILFDGFPRTYAQAYILEGLLLKMNTRLNCLLSLEVPRNVLLERMLKRFETEKRSDDNLEVIENRLREYDAKTLPVIDFYKEQNKYCLIDGLGSIEDVNDRLIESIEKMLAQTLINLVMFGVPGSGKGTQSKRLAERFNLVYISTGELIRQEIVQQTEMGKIAQPYLDSGDIVPDDIAIRLIERKIQNYPEAQGFIFKGFPSTLVQAYILDGLLKRIDSSVTKVIGLKTSSLLAMKRLRHRSKTENARSYDMDTDVIIHRLEVFEQKTAAVAEYYKKSDKFICFDSDADEDELFEEISCAIEKAIREVRK
ncbi:MAG: adenylate kinase [Bacteroidales bacterium]|nr:adenylate kinase [Bacteroidales bacterium]